MSKPTFLTSPDPEYHAATLRYSDFMTLGGHDLYRDLSDAAERELRLAALQGQREAIFDLARRRRISDEVSRRLVREIDLQEARYR